MPLHEKAVIAKLRRMAEASGHKGQAIRLSRHKIVSGIGDDCAVLRMAPGADLLVTTDFSLEGMHFRLGWHPAESVGHRCLARGLSDIAAMGGEPLAAFLSLAVPRHIEQSWVEKFARGLMRLAAENGVILAGGDTAESPNGVLADITIVGAVPRGRAILRSGAKAGDRVFVSGALGGSAAAVEELGKKQTLNARHFRRHFYPTPRIELGRLLREKKVATAMIDTSDGLSTDLGHICDESGVGAELDAELIPRARVGKPAREVALDLSLHGGEDYELLFTAPAGKSIPAQMAGVPVTNIGRITRSRKILVVNPGGSRYQLRPGGWEHFR